MNLNPLDQIHPWVMIAVAAIFTATYFALRRVFVLPYVHVMEEREKLLSEGEGLRADEAQVRQQAEREGAEVLAAASESADGRVKAAQAEADEYRSTTLATANAEASERLIAGRTAIAADRETAQQAMREQAIECVVLACERLVGPVPREDAESAVDDALGRLGR
ncbi:MAG: ATP synthase F0 subunit B [Coriobacteriales bacterium]|nr:ATP synthase F0 subunit B [Coriobacteriales bacterium]